jgi:hypothetical protein
MRLWQYAGYGNTLAQKYATCWFAGYIHKLVRCFNPAPNGCAMLGFHFGWLAMWMLHPMLVVQCLDVAPNCWRCNATTTILRLMAERCLGFAPDGGTMLDVATYGWRCNAGMLRLVMAQCLDIVDDSTMLWILHLMAVWYFGFCTWWWCDASLLRLMVARCLMLHPMAGSAMLGYRPQCWWRKALILRLMADGAMPWCCAQCWQRDTCILRLMAVQCLDIAPDGGTMHQYCAQR